MYSYTLKVIYIYISLHINKFISIYFCYESVVFLIRYMWNIYNMFQYLYEWSRSLLCDLLICLKILFACVCGHWPCVFFFRDKFVGTSYCFVLQCNTFPCLSNDFFFFTFNLLLVLILLSYIRSWFFFINTKEFFS